MPIFVEPVETKARAALIILKPSGQQEMRKCSSAAEKIYSLALDRVMRVMS